MPKQRARTHGSAPPQARQQEILAPTGNALFARLPTEIRCMIWTYVLEPPDPEDRRVNVIQSETKWKLQTAQASQRSLQTPVSLVKTCRLFWKDQQDYPVFYMLNEFGFEGWSTFAQYIATITSNRRRAIRHIFINGRILFPLFTMSQLAAMLLRCKSLRTIHSRQTRVVTSHLKIPFSFYTESLTQSLTGLLHILGRGLPALEMLHLKMRIVDGGYSVLTLSLKGTDVSFVQDPCYDKYRISSAQGEVFRALCEQSWRAARGTKTEAERSNQTQIQRADKPGVVPSLNDTTSDNILSRRISPRTRTGKKSISTRGGDSAMSGKPVASFDPDTGLISDLQVNQDGSIEFYYMDNKRDASWIASDMLLDNNLPDHATYRFFEIIYPFFANPVQGPTKFQGYIAREFYGIGGNVTRCWPLPHPQALIEQIKELVWENRDLENFAVKQLEDAIPRWNRERALNKIKVDNLGRPLDAAMEG